jgi:hypothetical protein
MGNYSDVVINEYILSQKESVYAKKEQYKKICFIYFMETL